MKSYVSLHTHSHGSWDAFGSPDDLVREVKRQRAPAIALTEHGSVGSAYELHLACQKHEVKPLFGIEAYMCDDMDKKGLSAAEIEDLTTKVPARDRKETIYQEERRRGILDRQHLTLLAMDDAGLQNLFKLSSLAWLRGHYIRPRLDLRALRQLHEGLIVLSGCPAGYLNEHLHAGAMGAAVDHALEMQDLLGDRYYIEVMPHWHKKLKPTCRPLVTLAKELGFKFVATQDAHWPVAGQGKYQDAVLTMRKDNVLINPNRFRVQGELHLRDRRQMEEAFLRDGLLDGHDVRKALDETLAIAERCSAKMPVGRPPQLPEVVPAAEERQHLRDLIEQGLRARGLFGLPQYQERIEHELLEIERRGVERYFLILHDLYKFVRKERLQAGWCRGSAGGCLVAYCLHITNVDPVAFDLAFSRFMSPGRTDLPDLDADFSSRDRDRCVQYLKDRWGDDRVVKIGTTTTVLGRGALRDVAKVMMIEEREVDVIADLIDEPQGEGDRPESTYAEAIRLAPAMMRDPHEKEEWRVKWQKLLEFHERYPIVLDYVRQIEGTTKSFGIHPGGIIVTPVPVIDVMPLELRIRKNSKDPGTIVTAFSMDGVAALGGVKIDVLVVESLRVLYEALDLANLRLSSPMSLEQIPFDDEATLETFGQGAFAGIFQYDTKAMRRLCEGLQFRTFHDIAALEALVRPGTSRSSFGKQYLENRRTGRTPSVHPIYDVICGPTYGVPLYQEQMVALFNELAGYSLVEADGIRRLCAKKKGVKAILAERNRFVAGCVERGISAAVADDILTGLSASGNYSFGKSHSYGYATIAYHQQWLKVHFPAEFFCACLRADEDRALLKDRKALQELSYFGVRIGAADIQLSDADWTIHGNELLPPITAHKGVGRAAAAAVAASKPYIDAEDLARRIERRGCNMGTLKILFQQGALRSLGITTEPDFQHLQELWRKIRPRPTPASPSHEIDFTETIEEERVHETRSGFEAELDPA